MVWHGIVGAGPYTVPIFSTQCYGVVWGSTLLGIVVAGMNWHGIVWAGAYYWSRSRRPRLAWRGASLRHRWTTNNYGKSMIVWYYYYDIWGRIAMVYEVFTGLVWLGGVPDEQPSCIYAWGLNNKNQQKPAIMTKLMAWQGANVSDGLQPWAFRQRLE